VKRIIDSLDDLGRFSEPALLIMISLADGPKHGYAMTQDIEQVSGQNSARARCTAPLRGSKNVSGSRRCRPRIAAGHTS
jgi:hypothetical protein